MAIVHPNPYVTADDLRATIGPQAYLAIFDDTNVGTVDAAAVALVLSRASGRVDGYLAKNYSAAVVPFLADVPIQAKEAALEFATGMAYLRRPEYASRYGEKGKVQEFERAEQLCKDLAENLQRLAAAPSAAPHPANVQGGVYTGPSDTSPDGVGTGIFSQGFGDF